MIDGIGKVALGMCFLDKEKEIPRSLDPIYKQFDKIYGIHGRFINYEVDHDYSIDNSVKAFLKYPNAEVHRYKPTFQPYMRQHYLDLAGEDKMDYLIVWDTDDIIYPSPECQNWILFWKNLKRYSKRYKEYRIFKMKTWIPSKSTWRRAYNAVRGNSWHTYIRIHKDPGTMRYCMDSHFLWCPKDASDEDIILQNRGLFVADHTIDGVRFTTNSFLRKEKDLDIRDRWAWNNDCEEKRRQYIKSSRLRYLEDINKPDWMDLELRGFWRYDDTGRPRTQICDEQGIVPKETVYY